MKQGIIWILVVMVLSIGAVLSRRVWEQGVGIGNAATTITMDGSGNMVLNDVNTNAITLFEILKVDSVAHSVDGDTLIGELDGESVKILLTSATPTPDPDPVTTYHPATIDQVFPSHPNVVNDDDIGYVHVTMTDSAYNNRSTGSYSWVIIGGNPGTAYKIGESTGFIEVNNYASVTSDFTLEVQISHNSVIVDTASVEIVYRTGEGTKLFYVDDTHGGDDDGSFLHPFQDASQFNAFADLEAGGFTILFARGTAMSFSSWDMKNGGLKNYVGAYGSGAKPIATAAASEQQIRLGNSSSPETNDCDSVLISNIRFEGYDGITLNHAILVERYSTNIEIYHCEFYRNSHTNGALYVRGVNAVMSAITVENNLFDTNDPDAGIGERAMKFEGGGLCVVQNNHVTAWQHTAMLVGDYSQNFGLVRFNRFASGRAIGVHWEPAMQVRSPATIDWNVVWRYYYGVEFENYSYNYTQSGSRVNKLIVEGCFNGIKFTNQDAAETVDWDDIIVSDMVVKAPLASGIDMMSSNAIGFTDVIFQKCIIFDSDDHAIEIDGSEVGNTKFYNLILYNSTNNDIQSDGAMAGAQMRNTIYDTKSHSFGTESDNYDYGTSGVPFVGGGDLRTASGYASVIEDLGDDIGYSFDMIDNTIENSATDTDIGPYNYGGSFYNWPNR